MGGGACIGEKKKKERKSPLKKKGGHRVGGESQTKGRGKSKD